MNSLTKTTKPPTLRQTTLDGTPYRELNRVNQPVVRVAKAHAEDYVLLVSGSRSIADDEWVARQLDRYVRRQRRGRMPIQLLHGESPGVDAAAVRWALDRNVAIGTLSVHPLYIQKWPRAEHGPYLAYDRRDCDLVDLADSVVALWDGKSGGTRRTKEYATQQGKLALEVLYGADEDSA